ncbi:peroxidase 2-like [Lolium rigidum]|uniref:peroxidase 2-like n=1 Tax=Lolium rigidum TaxID=89674 RepID=UPI001F5CAD5B|nr:peroxidase 2-like [Lolium rigidum]
MAMKLNTRAIVVSLCLVLVFFAGQPAAAHGDRGKKGTVGDKVYQIVAKEIRDNSGVGPALIRLLFHDCWVNGCDGSVLLDRKPYGSKTEKQAENNIGLDGFDVIDKIKAKLGDNVSCADIIVLAAREATFIVSREKIDYPVKTGRMDGVVSSAEVADHFLPPSTFDFEQLKANFDVKKFNTKELVALSGAHAIGVAHKSSFADRIDDATATPISLDYMNALKKDDKPIQPNNIRDKELAFRNASGYDPTGVDTTDTGKGVLDNSYYHANLQNTVLFRSDWELRNDTRGDAGGIMETFKEDAKEWYRQFGDAMAKLSKLPAEGTRFEIRKNCRKTN